MSCVWLEPYWFFFSSSSSWLFGIFNWPLFFCSTRRGRKQQKKMGLTEDVGADGRDQVAHQQRQCRQQRRRRHLGAVHHGCWIYSRKKKKSRHIMTRLEKGEGQLLTNQKKKTRQREWKSFDSFQTNKVSSLYKWECVRLGTGATANTQQSTAVAMGGKDQIGILYWPPLFDMDAVASWFFTTASRNGPRRWINTGQIQIVATLVRQQRQTHGGPVYYNR